ncbi:hypothetical protein E2C01_037754 [Portunus trituberculatus]|uniref:Fibronectin type-III domain-containing protein n=1 Tax=Portunus trituberculatus TaxID=210409 RepID=A0A5B7FA65_PORTR|nr:hypothetical protein [Portunus trituberculatus]
MGVMLPEIRSGKEEKRSLVDLVHETNKSPASIESLSSLLSGKRIQAHFLNNCVSAMPDIKFATRKGDLESVNMGINKTHTLCLVISLPSHKSKLEMMRQFCLGQQFSSSCQKVPGSVTTQQKNRRPTQEIFDEFRKFYRINKYSMKTSFIVTQEFSENDNTIHAQVNFYKNQDLISDNYELPSPPSMITTIRTKDVTITWNPPKHGASNITSYVVICYGPNNTIEFIAGRDETAAIIGREHTIFAIFPLLIKVEVFAMCEAGKGPSFQFMLNL